jgi:SAM-dependent methyltransferase
VTAVDSSPAAIALTLRLAPAVDARVADLETGGFAIEPAAYDLICDFFYLQRDLFPAIRAGVRPGGLFLGAMHMAGNNPNFVIRTGELPAQFPGWDVMHYAELPPLDGHRRPTAQIAVRRPGRYG